MSDDSLDVQNFTNRGRNAMSTPTVLIVEDEESFIEALQIGLRREGAVGSDVAIGVGHRCVSATSQAHPNSDHYGHCEGCGNRHSCGA